jgi:hypothetical protein
MKDKLTELSPDDRSARKTTDLCGHEHDGARCMRHRGHADRHESLFWRDFEVLRWD